MDAIKQAEALNQLQLGQLVKSRAGRDFGSYYLVYRLDKNKVWLVDGRGRTAANPKAKNPRHLQRVNLVAEELAAKISAGSLTPEDTRAALAGLLKKNPDEEALANVES